ncbi:wax ester/triacylglycerol synthase domain-containing protein [Nocardioides stalactiti]|uniref:wax ester/triacylglycerol synthase domain-containing protein n=1 Tax=Nocardioides stalactiti TaxID=2755356 RepID=UPI0016010CDF|nr:wax ester/triacylglycerol synthase domain-containing protein [Nocardioides stalactiti]
MPDRLSALDAAFLQVEDRQNRMQLAGMLVFDGPAPSYDDFRAAVCERLVPLPRFTQRLRQAPFGLTRPSWVDDDAFDLGYHVSRVALPGAGGDDEIAAHIDQLTSAPLDLQRPLWEVGLVEGVEGGFGVSLKVHHCMVDGLSIIDIFTALLAPDSALPDAPPAPRTAPAPRPAPPTSPVKRLQGVAGLLGQAPASILNGGDSGPTRRTAYVTVPLDHVHAVRRAHGTTVNNVVLAVVAGGLRRYLERHDALVDKLHAFVPVNQRAASARGGLGNQIGMTYPALPVGEPDPNDRLAAVVAEVTRCQETRQAAGTGALMTTLGLAPAPLAATLNRLVQLKGGMFNLTVTNVPGPPVEVHLLGRPLRLILGSTPLTAQHALTVAVLSYAGSLTFMVTTDPRRLPDGDQIADDLRAELETLRDHLTLTSTEGSAR